MLTQFRRKPLLLMLAVIVLAVSLWPAGAMAYVPYDTNYRDSYKRLVWTQSAYNPVEVMGREIYIPDPKDPSKQVFSPLVQPKDLFIDEKDNIYIADSGNNRIVHLDPNGNLVRILDVKESPMKKPEGLFIDGKGDIYVADTGNKRVIRLDSNGKLLKEYKRPDSKFLPEAFKYDPIKLVVDKRGFLYIATLGGYQGLLQLDPEGNFQSFFGANKTEFSVMDAFKRIVYTREMYLREISKLPGSVASVTTDKGGLIYTATKEIATGQIKKLNIAGKDLLSAKDEYTDKVTTRAFGEVRFPPSDKNQKPQLSDLTVDSDGNITAIDSTLKYVNQYDASGNLLFYWGGDVSASATKLGVVKTPSAIANNSKNELFILDEENNAVQRFRLSEFGALVHQANQLTQEGRYEDSEKYWQEVLRLNAYYTPAVLGLAKAAYKKGEFEKAQALFKEAGFVQGYSDAFWQIRLIWFQKHFGLLMNVVIFGFLLIFLFNRFTRKAAWRKKWRNRERSKNRLVIQLKHVFYILKHPIDGFSAIRYENKGSMASSMILLLAGMIAFGIMRVATDFTFNPNVVLEISLITVFTQFAVVWVGWVVANYLISTIYRGEGRFRDVIYGTSYAVFPFVIVGLPLTLLSSVMTLSEGAIYNFLENALYGWVFLLVFWKVQSMQNYGVGETAVNIVLSMVTMTILGVLIFITFGLSNELWDFFYSVYQEVTIR
ncbi:YIP1 family protein [Paenibacillus allorhizosphaerae]|uniref:Yip1 domain-containing protein n=1 Tax=Paenibacillus allorhizosphaerae TaxID=2849866 RepID=A0ABM8VKH6_9BACL|nr:YIP1 family protein [Paenibacillus allorhizosphaerae]CAG7646449.1 hypothetical protein PAECIP111802_03747 [Paenibacillus allorhizosphaerae]